jgi:aminoglycoside/choline kinase family phosphotransferase
MTPLDAKLPALRDALDPAHIGPLLDGMLGERAGCADDARWTAEILSQKAGRRCTIRYTATRGADGRPVRSVVAKVYADPDRAQSVYEWLRALGNAGVAGVPAPLGWLAGYGMVVQQHVAAGDLRDALQSGDWERPVALAAQWLAALHGTPAIAGLPENSRGRELARAEGWAADALPGLSADAQRELGQTVQRLRQAAREQVADGQTLIHRDFYPTHVLWDGARPWIVDFDQLSSGEGALDVGHFLAHLENLSYRMTGGTGAFAAPASLFLDRYLEQRPLALETALPFYQACTYLKLAAKEANRKRGAWQAYAGMLASLAARQAEALA